MSKVICKTMSQLKMPHKGWTNEHIAKSILSKFCFIAEPSCIGDDVGIDLFCTYFKIQDDKLAPHNSFAIQIKSNYDDIDITKNLAYYENLEIPFFVGVIDTSNCAKLKIYSGESICHFFTEYGNPMSTDSSHYNQKNKVIIELLNEKKHDPLYTKDSDKHKFILNFPLVVDIAINYDYEKSSREVQELFDLCRLIQKNIAYKNSNSYLYDIYGSDKRKIFAGSTSAKTFRKNFFDRFLEVIYNLNWISKNQPGDLRKDEIKTFKQMYELLKKCDFFHKNDELEAMLKNMKDE